MKLKLQKYDYTPPPKKQKTGMKGAIKSILIGLGLFPLFGLVTIDMQKTGRDPYSIMPFFMLPAMVLIIYGFCKLLKIMWDNIPE